MRLRQEKLQINDEYKDFLLFHKQFQANGIQAKKTYAFCLNYCVLIDFL